MWLTKLIGPPPPRKRSAAHTWTHVSKTKLQQQRIRRYYNI